MTRLRTGDGPVIEAELQPTPDHFSFSQMAMLLPAYQYACPRKWGYRYLARLPERFGWPLYCGTALDAGLNRWFADALRDGPGRDINTAVDEATFAARMELQRAIANAADPPDGDINAYTVKVVEGMAAVIAAEGMTPTASVQQRHEFTVEALDHNMVTVVGWSDRINADGTIVDHKWVGSAKWNADNEWDDVWLWEKRDQLAMYWLARRAEERRGEVTAAPVVPRGRLVVVCHSLRRRDPQVRVVDFAFDEGDEWRVIQRIRQGDAIIRDGRLPARPGRVCTFCPFAEQCREDELARGQSFGALVGSSTLMDVRAALTPAAGEIDTE